MPAGTAAGGEASASGRAPAWPGKGKEDGVNDRGEGKKGMFRDRKDLYALMESIHDNVVISDSKGVIQWVSPSCEETYGMKSEEFVGRDTFEMERRRIWYPAVAPMVLRSKEKVTILEQTRKGEELVVTGFPLLNAEGEIERVISYSFDPTYLLELGEQFKKMRSLVSRYSAELRELREKEMHLPGVIAKSAKMDGIFKLIMKVAEVETHVLITGESGVGKSLIARKIHQNSLRSKGPFIEINCGSIPENLLESELFGYEPGAFTGAQRGGKVGMIELAQEGTLLLDEVGELPLPLQVKLLKVIQDKVLVKVGGTRQVNVDFRLVAATNQDLESLVAEGRFREDLFYRLNVVPIHVPPLRERPEDIFPLTQHFLTRANKRYGKRRTLSGDAVNALIAHDWPGNVRQLQNMVERLVIIADEDPIGRSSLPEKIRTPRETEAEENLPLKRALERLEAKLIRKAYAEHKTTVGVAKALEISQSSAARKVMKYVTER